MGYKRIIRKIATVILASQPETFTKVEVAQINHGGILSGQTVLITGGGRGLGFYMARKFISEGARVIISGRKENTLKKAASELGHNCQYVVYDVTDVKKSVDFLKECWGKHGGKLDCLVSNQGSLYMKTIF